MKKLTYEEFVKTGRNTLLANGPDPTLYADLEFGRVYADFCTIALLPCGKWLLVIENADWEDWDVRSLEKRLYEDFYGQLVGRVCGSLPHMPHCMKRSATI